MFNSSDRTARKYIYLLLQSKREEMAAMDAKRTEVLVKRLCLALDQWRLSVMRGSQQLAAIVNLRYPSDQEFTLTSLFGLPTVNAYHINY